MSKHLKINEKKLEKYSSEKRYTFMKSSDKFMYINES